MNFGRLPHLPFRCLPRMASTLLQPFANCAPNCRSARYRIRFSVADHAGGALARHGLTEAGQDDQAKVCRSGRWRCVYGCPLGAKWTARASGCQRSHWRRFDRELQTAEAGLYVCDATCVGLAADLDLAWARKAFGDAAFRLALATPLPLLYKTTEFTSSTPKKQRTFELPG